MNYLSLILRITAIFSVVIACVLYFLTAGKIEEKEKELSQFRTEVQALIDSNESANLEIAKLREELVEKTRLTEEAKVQVEEAKAELVAEMQESQRVQNRLIETQKKVSQMEEATNRLRKELLNAENMFATASQEGVIAQLSDRIEELTTANDQLKDKILALKTSSGDDVSAETPTSTTDLVQFTVQTLTPDEVSAIKDETKIASLSTANGIIVLNADEKLNLMPGIVMKLVKGSEAIAQVKVININGSLAIASILPGAKLDDLSKGDTVKILR